VTQHQKSARQWAIEHVGVVVVIGDRTWTLDAAGGTTVSVKSVDDGEERRVAAETVMRAYMRENGGGW
jgi:hypothetical protein